MNTSPTQCCRRGPAALTAILVLATFLLSACGLKTSSVTTFDDNFAGKRTITMTLSKEDLEQYVTGGADAAEAAALKHLPPEMNYEGKTVDDKGLTATLSIEYSSMAEYQQKITAILAAGGIEAPEFTMSNSTEGLVTGVLINESFADSDLLKWLEEALIAEGIVDESHRSEFFDSSPDAPQLVIGQKTYKSSSNYSLTVSEVTDNGVSYLGVAISMLPDNYLETKVLFSNGSQMTPVQRTKITEFVQAHLPAGAEVTENATDLTDFARQDPGVLVKFTADSPEAVQEGLRTLTGSEQTSFTVEEPTFNEDSFAMLTPISGHLDCSTVCTTKNVPEVEFILVTTEDTQAVGDYYLDRNESGHKLFTTGQTLNLALSQPVLFSRVEVATELGFGSDLSTEIGIEVDREANPKIDFEQLDKAFTNSRFSDLVSTSDEGSTHRYTITVSGSDVNEYNQKLTSVIPDAYLHRTEVSSGLFKHTTAYSLYLPVRDLFGQSEVPATVEESVTLPFAHSFDTKATATLANVKIDGKTLVRSGDTTSASELNFTESGFTLTGLIILGVLLALLIAAAVAGYIFRDKIRAKLNQKREERAVRAQAAPQPVYGSYPAGESTVTGINEVTTPPVFASTSPNTATMGTTEMGIAGLPAATHPTGMPTPPPVESTSPNQFHESQLM